MEAVLKSKAVWTALLGFIGTLVMYFTQVPAEIWQSFVVFATALMLAFIGQEVTTGITTGIVAGIRELRRLEREEENK